MKGHYWWKCKFCRLCFQNLAFSIDHNLKNDKKSQFAEMKSLSKFFEVVLCFLWFLVTGPSFMSISSLVLQLRQFSFTRDWSEIWTWKIPSSKFCPISRDWGKLETPNLAGIFLIKYYWIRQIARLQLLPFLSS